MGCETTCSYFGPATERWLHKWQPSPTLPLCLVLDVSIILSDVKQRQYCVSVLGVISCDRGARQLVGHAEEQHTSNTGIRSKMEQPEDARRLPREEHMAPSTPPAAGLAEYASDPESAGARRRARRVGMPATKSGLMRMKVGKRGWGTSVTSTPSSAVVAFDDAAAGTNRRTSTAPMTSLSVSLGR